MSLKDFFSPLPKARPYAEVRSEIAAAEAKERGCVVVVPKPNQLFVDIDSNAQLDAFWKSIKVLKRNEQAIVKVKSSPSGAEDHFHIVVTLKRNVDASERILLQAALGSDPMREILSWQRLRNGDPTPTLFFEVEP